MAQNIQAQTYMYLDVNIVSDLIIETAFESRVDQIRKATQGKRRRGFITAGLSTMLNNNSEMYRPVVSIDVKNRLHYALHENLYELGSDLSLSQSKQYVDIFFQTAPYRDWLVYPRKKMVKKQVGKCMKYCLDRDGKVDAEDAYRLAEARELGCRILVTRDHSFIDSVAKNDLDFPIVVDPILAQSIDYKKLNETVSHWHRRQTKTHSRKKQERLWGEWDIERFTDVYTDLGKNYGSFSLSLDRKIYDYKTIFVVSNNKNGTTVFPLRFNEAKNETLQHFIKNKKRIITRGHNDEKGEATLGNIAEMILDEIDYLNNQLPKHRVEPGCSTLLILDDEIYESKSFRYDVRTSFNPYLEILGIPKNERPFKLEKFSKVIPTMPNIPEGLLSVR